jgi:hypothetical protein
MEMPIVGAGSILFIAPIARSTWVTHGSQKRGIGSLQWKTGPILATHE